MKLAAFSIEGNRKTGVVKNGGLIDLSQVNPGFDVDVMEIVEQGEPILERIRQAETFA